MNHVLYIIPILLAVTIPNAFAEVGQNYDSVNNEDGSITWTSHPERIMDGTWKNYVFQNTDDKVIFNSNSIGSFVFDKDSCSYSIYENGFVNPETQIIPSVSAVATHNNGAWSNMDVNDSSCDVIISDYDNGITLTSTKVITENVTGFEIEKFVQEINLDIFKGIKETFYIYDDSESGNELGISQTIHVGETIVMGNNTEIKISDFDGMSFDRDFIIENEAEILQVAKNLRYDMDEGIDYLSSVNIIHDSSFFDNTYKVNLDYSNGSFIGYLEIDPTFSATPSDDGWFRDNNGDNVCSTVGLSQIGTAVLEPHIYGGGSSAIDCQLAYIEFPITGIPTSGIAVTDLELSFYVMSVLTPDACDVRPIISNQPSSSSAQSIFTEIMGGSDYTQLPECQSTGQKSNMDLGTQAKADFVNYGTGNGWFAIGLKQDTDTINAHRITSIASASHSSYNPPTLSVTYVSATVPTAPQSLTTSQSVANEIILNWSAPSSNGNSAITNYKIYLDGSLIDTIGNVLTYTDTISGAEIGSGLTYKVVAVNAIGNSPDSNTSFITSWDVPDAPTGFQAITGMPITLSWVTPNSDDTITNYKIYRDSSLIDTITPANSYTDNTAVTANSYTYEISAVSGVGESVLSASSSATAGIPWNPPSSVSAVISDPDNSPFDISVSWSASTQGSGTGTLTGYEVWRTNGATTLSIATLGNVLTYSDTVSLANTNFEYFVKSTSTQGPSGNSPVSNTVTTANVPDAITDLSGNIISDTQINISWTAPNNGGSNIDLYKIYRDGSQIDTTTNTSYSLTGLTANTSYTITVFSNNSVGDSLVSNSVTLTTYVPISGSITVTANTQGASTQLTFSSSGITGTPTPTFSTFTLKEGSTVIASGITSPYILALNDDSSHTYTVTSTDNTHWNTPTISGSTTVQASYNPTWNNNISYNYTRASGVMDLTVNRDTQNLWDATCNYKTTAQVMADQSGIVSNFTNVWYINDSQNIADTETVYVSCNEDGTTLFSFTSFGPNRLGGGIAQLDAVFGEWTGTPVALIFVLLVAGLFTGRSAPTGILLVLALIGVLGFIGMLTIDEAVWGFLLLAGVLGIFLGKRFL